MDIYFTSLIHFSKIWALKKNKKTFRVVQPFKKYLKVLEFAYH